MPLPLLFDAQGLVPAIIQDHLTGQIRMFAYATEAAIRMTLDTGYATFWSRSRQELWQKGRVSGIETPVVKVLADCDGDCVIYSSDPSGPSCHSGAPSCFFQALEGEHMVQASEQPQSLIALLETSANVRADAQSMPPPFSREGEEQAVQEAADALYRLIVGLRARSIPVRRVLAELARRMTQH
jgi:phosphoribosyl-ATP pyrophosphohydrolase/phosphoribosyl-AMP cyclohydrolase